LQGITSPYPDWYRNSWNRIREYAARFKAYLNCEILHSSPQFTGPTIPIGGDGRATIG